MRYQVIYADPPWQYRNKNTGGSLKSGAAAKYQTMTVDEICALGVHSITSRSAVLFLWVTVPMLPEGLRVLKAWGFQYKTMLTWRKVNSLGMGFWFRGQTEHVLVGVRGKVKAFRCQCANFIQTKALRHSQKPEEMRTLIRQATKGLRRRIELFARQKVKGWHVWGNEVECDIMLTLLPSKIIAEAFKGLIPREYPFNTLLRQHNIFEQRLAESDARVKSELRAQMDRDKERRIGELSGGMPKIRPFSTYVEDVFNDMRGFKVADDEKGYREWLARYGVHDPRSWGEIKACKGFERSKELITEMEQQ